MRQVKIAPYDSSWPEEFLIESQKVKKALGDNCIEVHHIGSTAVFGLAGKPVLDLMPVVLHIDRVDLCNKEMEKLGYKPRGEDGIPLRRYFRKGENIRTHHVHVFQKDNPEIARHLRFRDWLCNNPDDMKAYEILKRNLAIQFSNDISAYTSAKDEFIAMIDQKTKNAL